MSKHTQAERMRQRAKRDFARGRTADEDFRRHLAEAPLHLCANLACPNTVKRGGDYCGECGGRAS